MDVREKLVEVLDKVHHKSLGKEYLERLGTIADYLISNGVTVQEWISVKDRLPEIYDKEPDWSVTVLFRTIQGHIHSGYRNIGRPQKSFYDDDWTTPYWLDESENLTFEEDEVTHWQYLPQPPKGE